MLNKIKSRCTKELRSVNLSQEGLRPAIKPYLIHRLDKHATGIMIVATNSYAARELSESLRNFGWRKKYIAEIEGIVIQKQGRIDDPIMEKARDYLAIREDFRKDSRKNKKDISCGKGFSQNLIKDGQFKLKRAITEYRVLGYRDGRTLLELRPITGRMHQLRQHCAKHLYPIVGDEKYCQRGEEDYVAKEEFNNRKAFSSNMIRKDSKTNPSQGVFSENYEMDQSKQNHTLLSSAFEHPSFNGQGLRLRCVEISFEFRGKNYCYRC